MSSHVSTSEHEQINHQLDEIESRLDELESNSDLDADKRARIRLELYRKWFEIYGRLKISCSRPR